MQTKDIVRTWLLRPLSKRPQCKTIASDSTFVDFGNFASAGAIFLTVVCSSPFSYWGSRIVHSPVHSCGPGWQRWHRSSSDAAGISLWKSPFRQTSTHSDSCDPFGWKEIERERGREKTGVTIIILIRTSTCYINNICYWQWHTLKSASISFIEPFSL